MTNIVNCHNLHITRLSGCHMQVYPSRNYILTVKPPSKHTSLPSMVATFLATCLMAVLQSSRYSIFYSRDNPIQLGLLWWSYSCQCVIFQTPKHVRDMFNFNTTSNPRRYLVLFVSKTPSVVWYFIMDLLLPKVRGYFALFESKSAVIFICIHCLIISFKLRKFTWNLRRVFPFPNLNFYIVFL